MTRASETVESVKYSGKLYQGHGPLEEKMEVEDEEEKGQEVSATASSDSPPGDNDAASMNTNEEGTAVEGVSSRPKRTIKVPRRNSLDANAGGEDILVNPRRKNPGVGVKMTREVQEACDKINWGRGEEVMCCQAQGHLSTSVNSCEVYKPQRGP